MARLLFGLKTQVDKYESTTTAVYLRESQILIKLLLLAANVSVLTIL